jgi:hypothetical protein
MVLTKTKKVISLQNIGNEALSIPSKQSTFTSLA